MQTMIERKKKKKGHSSPPFHLFYFTTSPFCIFCIFTNEKYLLFFFFLVLYADLPPSSVLEEAQVEAVGAGRGEGEPSRAAVFDGEEGHVPSLLSALDFSRPPITLTTALR